MNLRNKNILFAAQYSAPYMGNFIASLATLEQHLSEKYDAKCAYLFPKETKQTPWIANFSEDHKVYFSGQTLSDSLDEIIDDFQPDLIHTHFEGYDLPVYKAVKKCHKHIRQVWHMHDTLSYHKNPIKSLYQKYCFFKHYGLPFIKDNAPGIIAVCEHESRFISPFRLYKQIHQTIIPNGISLTRIKLRQDFNPKVPFSFLAFAGRNIQKRTDYIVEASRLLTNESIDHRIIIIASDQAKVDIEGICGKLPDNIEVMTPHEDINNILAMGDCFVSTSIHETFSYAIAEAAYYGLPVIQSNIEGTKWSEPLPTTFVFSSGNIIELKDVMKKVMNIHWADMQDKCKFTSLIIKDGYSLDAWADKVIDFFVNRLN